MVRGSLGLRTLVAKRSEFARLIARGVCKPRRAASWVSIVGPGHAGGSDARSPFPTEGLCSIRL